MDDTNKEEEQQQWSVVVGGSRGQLYQRPLDINHDNKKVQFATSEDDIQRLRPSHAGSVVSMTSPASGLLITGAQDGTIRVWDCTPHNHHDDIEANEEEEEEEEDSSFWNRSSDTTSSSSSNSKSSSRPTCMYALTGYKVWLGSIVTDGKRLISDGADNTIVVHDFSGEDDLDNNIHTTMEEDDYDDDFSMDD